MRTYMKNKKILFIFTLVLAILILFSIKVEAALELNYLNFDAQINEDGSMDVTETWNIYISDTNTLFKTFIQDNLKYSKITDVKVVETTNGLEKNFTKINQEMYHVTKDCYYGLENSNGMFEIAWGVGLDNSSATRQYKISYKVVDAITQYKDFSELYWQFIGEEFEINAKKITGTIILPNSVENKEDIRVWGHTKDLNGEIYVTDLNKIEFIINKYSKGNYVEVRTLFPNNIILSTTRKHSYDILDKALKEETEWANIANTNRKIQKNIEYTVIGITIITTIVLCCQTCINMNKLIKMEKKIKPTKKMKYFRDIPYEDATPAEALFMLTSGKNKTFPESFSANILNLCLKKYISLEVIKDKEIFKEKDIVKIILQEKDYSILKEDEKLTMEFLIEVAGNEKEVTTKDITKYLNKHILKIKKLNKKLSEILENQESLRENYNKENYKKRKQCLTAIGSYIILCIYLIPTLSPFLWIFVTMKVRIISSLVILLPLTVNVATLARMAYRINVFSQKGVDEQEQWKALKKYMEDFSLLKDKEIPSLVIWEKYLVYATAFGISEKVLEQLKIVYPEISYINSTMYTYSYIHIMNSVNIGNCINSSIYSSMASSGRGAGGGFSGGGGGGRRPVVAEADDK